MSLFGGQVNTEHMIAYVYAESGFQEADLHRKLPLEYIMRLVPTEPPTCSLYSPEHVCLVQP